MRAINLRPSGSLRLVLALLPFLALLLAYVIGSHIRLAENPNDKLLPSFADMGETIYAYAFEADPRTGQYLLWSDTAASLTRLLIGLAISAVFALVVGILIGLLPIMPARRSGRSSPCCRWCRRWRCCRSCSSSWGSAKPSKITLIVVGTTLEADPRHRAARRRHSARAADQGADARRLHGADRLAHRAAADPAAAHRFRAAGDRPGLAVPDRGRGDRRRLAASATASSSCGATCRWM